MTPLIYTLWLAILWTFSNIFPRPFDDWKNALLYIGAGVIVIAVTIRRGIAGPVAVVCTSPQKAARPQTTVPPAIPLLIVISYLLICAASIAVAPTGRYEGLLELARMILWAGLAWVFAQCSIRTWLGLMRATVVSAAIIAALTWMQSHGSDIWPYSGIFLAPIGHISYYGDFMALSLVMAVGVLFLDPRYPFKLAAGTTICVCMFLIDVGLALSATRASLVGVIVALLVAVPLVSYATRSFKQTVIIALIGALNLAVIFSLPIKSIRGESTSTRFQQATNISQATIEGASSGRWHTYVTSAHIAMERPLLGWGLGTFRFVYPEFAQRNKPDSLVSSATWYMHPHNEALHQAVEVGWTGAILWIFGIGYLLYGGIYSCRHPGACPREGGGEQILLITALCGLVAAVVSWQFSTNFLFPVSRLMTALFVGIILSFVPHSLPLRGRMAEGQESGKFKWAMMTTVALSTLLLTAYQISLMCVQKEQSSTTLASARRYADWAVRLAPGAFDPLFVRASVALRTEPLSQAARAVESLYESYPYTPAVLHLMGYLRSVQGNIPEARKLLQHAIANDPTNSAAKQLLDRLPPEDLSK